MEISEAPRFEYVTLVSLDGYEFVVPYEAVLCSGTLRRMLDPKNSFQEAITGRCVLETIRFVPDPDHRISPLALLRNNNHSILSCSGYVLVEVCFYFLYNYIHRNDQDVKDMEIPTELCLELLMAADYLDV
ncbi:POZ domain-containing protein [Penicillium verhagenii]|uniref:POZ domain-containing protein n=1 Tax=Penicillium verhagenii TaxID=1562060 RepID=UPI00254550A2|nr:POZ domain-containing protein [Penicillium verhagenii]KAJ5918516.1 POZ domain-containing protein [Penicillium verhagenii]